MARKNIEKKKKNSNYFGTLLSAKKNVSWENRGNSILSNMKNDSLDVVVD